MGATVEGGPGGAEFVNHRMLGEDIDVMSALHQSPHGAQFGRDGAATVDEREQVRQRTGGVHRTALLRAEGRLAEAGLAPFDITRRRQGLGSRHPVSDSPDAECVQDRMQ